MYQQEGSFEYQRKCVLLISSRVLHSGTLRKLSGPGVLGICTLGGGLGVGQLMTLVAGNVLREIYLRLYGNSPYQKTRGWVAPVIYDGVVDGCALGLERGRVAGVQGTRAEEKSMGTGRLRGWKDGGKVQPRVKVFQVTFRHFLRVYRVGHRYNKMLDIQLQKCINKDGTGIEPPCTR